MSRPFKHCKKWRIRWCDEYGKRQSEVYVNYKDAEFMLKKHLLEVEEIKRGILSATIKNKTINDLCDYWLEKRTPYKRSPKDDRSMIRNHIRPCFGLIKAKDLNTSHTDNFIATRNYLNSKTVSNILTLLISMLYLANELNWINKVPKIKKPKTFIFSTDYNFLRTDEEIKKFLMSAQDEGDLFYTLYSAAIYTGLREGELAGLKWSDIDFEKRFIIVQRSFDKITKSGTIRYVPILDALLPTLMEWKLKNRSEWVFPNQRGTMQKPSARIFQEIFQKVLIRAGFPTREICGKKRGFMVFHDLRHSFASHWIMKGGDIFKLQKILGHSSILITMRYSHLAPNAFSSDYHRFKTFLPPQTAKIINF